MYLVNNLTKTPAQNLNLNAPIPSCMDSYVQIRAQYHKTYIGTSKYRLERISRYFSSYLIKDLTISPYARYNINSFITHRLASAKPGTVRKDAAALQVMLNWIRRDIGLQIPDIFKQIRLPKNYGVRQFIPTYEQVKAVVARLPTEELSDICMLKLERQGCLIRVANNIRESF